MENGQSGVVSSADGALTQPAWVPRYPSIEDSWYDLVELYSKCQLTKSFDRLPAFAGMASQYARHYDRGQYLAGHWEHDLPCSLVWYREGSPSQRDAEKPRSPSWAWSSVNGAVYFPGKFTEPVPVAQCLAIGIEVVGEYYLGNVKHAILELLAPILRAAVSDDPSDADREARRIQVFEPCGSVIDRATIFLDVLTFDSKFELLVLSIDPSSRGEREIGGIVLQRDEEKGSCGRIGAFTAYWHLTVEQLPPPSRIRLH